MLVRSTSARRAYRPSTDMTYYWQDTGEIDHSTRP